MDEKIKAILEREFAADDIDKDFNKFDYVKPHLVIGRLNEAFGQDGWQFVPEERVVDDDWIIQFGKIGILNEAGEWVWKYNCGGKRRTLIKNSDKYLNMVNDYKSAMSNCLKRCAMLLGVALHLYGDTEQSDEDAPERPPRAQGGQPPSRPQQKPPKASGSASDASSGGIGDLKNRLLALESKKKAEGMAQSQVMALRGEKLGDNTLNHSAEKLTAYGDALAAHGDDAGNELDQLPDTPGGDNDGR